MGAVFGLHRAGRFPKPLPRTQSVFCFGKSTPRGLAPMGASPRIGMGACSKGSVLVDLGRRLYSKRGSNHRSRARWDRTAQLFGDRYRAGVSHPQRSSTGAVCPRPGSFICRFSQHRALKPLTSRSFESICGDRFLSLRRRGSRLYRYGGSHLLLRSTLLLWSIGSKPRRAGNLLHPSPASARGCALEL